MGPRRLGALAQWHAVQPAAVHTDLGLACSFGRCPGSWVVWEGSAAGCNSDEHAVCAHGLESVE
eukprot:7657007-Alexandrium_andersonii.AAC.1